MKWFFKIASCLAVLFMIALAFGNTPAAMGASGIGEIQGDTGAAVMSSSQEGEPVEGDPAETEPVEDEPAETEPVEGEVSPEPDTDESETPEETDPSGN